MSEYTLTLCQRINDATFETSTVIECGQDLDWHSLIDEVLETFESRKFQFQS